MSLVSFAKIAQQNHDKFKQSILDSLNLISYSFPKGLKKVVIKPNMCYYWDYSTGQTTDPKFVAALIDVIRDQIRPNLEISIVESDASAMKCKHSFKMLGYEKLARDKNVKLIDLSEEPYEYVRISSGERSFGIRLPEIIQKADLKINVPKIKYATKQIELTCALKNIFGCNPYPKKFQYHPILGEAIVAANKAMRFDLCIIDGNIVSGIQPRRLGLVMASHDPVAIDSAAAEIAGLNARKIKYFQLASKEGLGSIKFIPRGMPMVYFKERYPRKTVKRKVMSRAYNLVRRIGLGAKLGLE